MPLLLLLAFLASLPACTTSSLDNSGGITPDTEVVSATAPLTIRSSNFRYFARDNRPVHFAGPGGPEDLFYHGGRGMQCPRSGGDPQAFIDTLAADGGDALYVEAV